MSQWQPSSSVQVKGFYDCFLHNKTLVKIYLSGQYLALFNEKNLPDTEVPHIEVLLDRSFENGKYYYTHAKVRVYSPKKNRPSLIMTTWNSGKQPKSLSPDILINLAKTQLDAAEKTLLNMKKIFKAAKERVKKARAFPTIFNTREEYEKACNKLSVPIFSDELCQSYTIQYGDFKFPDYSGDQCLTLKLARRRLRGILSERYQGGIAKPANIPSQGEQQWEPCRVCGNQPRFLPLLACDKCWPRT